MQTGGSTTLSGQVALKVIRGGHPSPVMNIGALLTRGHRKSFVERELKRLQGLFTRLRVEELPEEIDAMEHSLGLPSALSGIRAEDREKVLRAYFKILTARMLAPIAGVTVLDSSLSLAVRRAEGPWQPLGVVSRRVVTTTGVGFIVDAFQNIVELEIMKYHGLGTGAVAEAAADTALGTELTTEYNPNSTRATGTTAEAAATIYQTVGTNTVDATAAVTEHGILSQAATGGGVLLDRSVFSVINLASGDSLQSTYSLTLTAGG